MRLVYQLCLCSPTISLPMNRLSKETSPYLLQHADNPVDWYPWGDEALNKARAENRPILLSVGYSACHWCHVMAHESFEDRETAALMNRLFVNIKVDREERPDLDRIYQTAHQLIVQRPGGWPLTMFLTPEDHLPFFGGTYFPGSAGLGLPAFTDILERVAHYYQDNQFDIRQHGRQLLEVFEQLEPGDPVDASSLHRGPLDSFRASIGKDFDSESGGFGGAPKFPQSGLLEQLLRRWRDTAFTDSPDTDALYMCALTLQRMYEGGIYDHLGGGFCRYSVDGQWQIPHFEKMLYDNGPLLALYARLWQISADDIYRTVADETADWVLREMRSPQGAFYAALDADSEGEEGRFYAWTPDEIRDLLPDEEYEPFAARYGLDRQANFEDRWHLVIARSLEDISQSQTISQAATGKLIREARGKLLAARNERVRPGLDDKVLTSWNALMVRGLAIAARVLGRQDLASAATQCVDFIRGHLTEPKRLLACHAGGQSRFEAYLDDYACLLDAVVELLQTRWDSGQLEFACWIADCLLENFHDTSGGGFWFTSANHEQLVHRNKPMSDDAMPSGNAVAALALGRLGYLLGNRHYLDAAESVLRAGWSAMEEFPRGHASLLIALDEYLSPPEIVVIMGNAEALEEWSAAANAVYAPRRLVFAIPDSQTDLPGALATRIPATTTVAYICRGTTCDAPVMQLADFSAALAAGGEA